MAPAVPLIQLCCSVTPVQTGTDLAEAEEGVCRCARSLHSPHRCSTPASHPRLTLLRQLHTSFTPCSHLHALRMHPTARFTPTSHPALHPSSHPFDTHFTTPYASFGVLCSDCSLFDHGSLVVCLCLMGQYLTFSGISFDSCLANIDHFYALQAAAARAGAPAPGWRGSRRRWRFSGRREPSSG